MSPHSLHQLSRGSQPYVNVELAVLHVKNLEDWSFSPAITMNGLPPPQGLWAEARNPEGRIYYYNTLTKATQWTKPEDLMNPVEVRLSLDYGHLEANCH